VPEKDFDQRRKVSRVKNSALQLAAVSRPVSAETGNFTARWADLLVRNGQRTNHRPASRGDKRSALINKNVQRLANLYGDDAPGRHAHEPGADELDHSVEGDARVQVLADDL
jgi:hypothetical protein